MTRSKRNMPRATSARHMGRAAWIAGGSGLAIVVAVGVVLFAGRHTENVVTSAAGAIATASDRAESAFPVVDVYKTPTCGCCSKWVDHLRQEGFEVRTTDMRDLTDFKVSHGVPRQVESCHTALVGGYVIEGHVPGSDVRRLLEERPSIAGLAAPGMPVGSPGMEVPGAETPPYDVIAFDKDGATRVFATHGR
ncbi:MAG: DUF411 domain-containing protein [Vicinamibacterales bacterium]